MIEVLHKLGDGTCRHCGGPIELMCGDLTGERWYHASSDGGGRHCPGSPVAEPLLADAAAEQDAHNLANGR